MHADQVILQFAREVLDIFLRVEMLKNRSARKTRGSSPDRVTEVASNATAESRGQRWSCRPGSPSDDHMRSRARQVVIVETGKYWSRSICGEGQVEAIPAQHFLGTVETADSRNSIPRFESRHVLRYEM